MSYQDTRKRHFPASRIKGYILSDFNCDILEKANYSDSKMIGSCQGFGGREDE